MMMSMGDGGMVGLKYLFLTPILPLTALVVSLALVLDLVPDLALYSLPHYCCCCHSYCCYCYYY